MRSGMFYSDYTDPKIIDSVILAPKKTLDEHRSEFDAIFKAKFAEASRRHAIAVADVELPRRHVATMVEKKSFFGRTTREISVETVPAPADASLPEKLLDVMARLWFHVAGDK